MPHPGLDEAYAIPTEKSQRLALGTQQILAEETNITKTVDPLGGSYYIEWLTNRIEQEIAEKMKEVEKRGGAIYTIKDGFMQRDIFEFFREQQEAIATGKRVVVRKNKYQIDEEEAISERIELHHPDDRAIEEHIENLRKIKARRDDRKVRGCLDTIKKTARGKENLMPYLIEAAKAYVSIGEITGALKEVWGEYKEPRVI